MELLGVADALARADGRGQRHDRGAAGVLELAADDGVVAAVRQDDEARLHEQPGGAHGLFVVGEQGGGVADDLELDEVGLQGLPRQLRRQHGVFGGEAAGGVGQQRDPQAPQVGEHAFARRLQLHAADGDGDEVGPGRGYGGFALLEAGDLAGAHDQARGEGVGPDGEHGSAPADGGDDVDPVALGQGPLGQLAARDDVQVQGDGDAAPLDVVPQLGQQVGERQAVVDLPALAVQLDPHRRGRPGRCSSRGP